MMSKELPYTVKLMNNKNMDTIDMYHLSTLNKIQVLLDVMPHQPLNF